MKEEWIDRPISQFCEKLVSSGRCGKPATHAYQAYQTGWMSLCIEHAQPHLSYSVTLQQAVRLGHQLKAVEK